MRAGTIVAAVAVLAAASAAYAQDDASTSVQGRLERIEKAVDRIEAKLAHEPDSGMMQQCQQMMKGGMRGHGMMRGGMMGDGMMGGGMMGGNMMGGSGKQQQGDPQGGTKHGDR